jgi:hypothetical protein
MAGNASNQRIIPLEEGWNDEIKAKVSKLLWECYHMNVDHHRETRLFPCIVARLNLAQARSSQYVFAIRDHSSSFSCAEVLKPVTVTSPVPKDHSTGVLARLPLHGLSLSLLIP